MTRFVLLVVLAGVFVVARAPAAHACSCAARPVADVVSVADAAFVGRVDAVPDVSGVTNSAASVTWRFRVGWVVKGDLPSTVAATSSAFGASCGVEGVARGDRVALALHRDGKGWSTGLCDQLDPASVRALPGHTPAHAPIAVAHGLADGPVTARHRSGDGLKWWFIGGGVALGAAVLLLAVAGARRRSVVGPPG